MIREKSTELSTRRHGYNAPFGHSRIREWVRGFESDRNFIFFSLNFFLGAYLSYIDDESRDDEF